MGPKVLVLESMMEGDVFESSFHQKFDAMDGVDVL
jgi:hypothetical protein